LFTIKSVFQIKRAKEIGSLLKAQGFQVENPWDLVRMSRDYGFTPIDKSCCSVPKPLKSSENCGARYSEAHPVYDWLGSKSNEPREPQESVVIDVEGRLSPGKKGKEKGTSRMLEPVVLIFLHLIIEI
jgi:hypothetical protein